jgi:tRNA 2-thiouridine synthesizing protein E
MTDSDRVAPERVGPQPSAPADLAALHAKIDALSNELLDRQRRSDVVFDDLSRIMRSAALAGTAQLETLEARGWIRMGRTAIEVLDHLARRYTREELDAFADNVVSIAETFRMLTQPDVLAMATEAGEAIQRADEAEPMGVLGMLKASKDDDVQRGMAVVLEVLRHVGRTTRERPAGDDAPRRPIRRHPKRAAGGAPARPAHPDVRPPAVRRAPNASQPANALPTIEGDWSRDKAEVVARAAGVALTDDHWAVIEFARADFAEKGASPNVRRLANASGVGVKALYGLFPKAPGKTVAAIAGIPKPAGCI